MITKVCSTECTVPSFSGGWNLKGGYKSCRFGLILETNIRGMAGKFVDTISIFNKKRNSIKMNISGFAKIFHEQIDEILLKCGQHDIFYSLLCAPP